MLRKFEVCNFKCFKEKLVLDFSDVKQYDFSNELICNRTVRSGVIFGKNDAGKTNLSLELFDIVAHLTDKLNI